MQLGSRALFICEYTEAGFTVLAHVELPFNESPALVVKCKEDTLLLDNIGQGDAALREYFRLPPLLSSASLGIEAPVPPLKTETVRVQIHSPIVEEVDR